MKKFAAIALASGCLAACSSTYQRSDVTAASSKLAMGNSVLIATPANGKYDGREYANSGTSTASAVRGAFVRYSGKIKVDANCRDFDCLKSAGPADYYVIPEILHWEDRATEWSGKKDKLEVKIAIFDVSGKELSSSIISGKSKWATFGGDHPQDLLPEPINAYVQTLY